MYIFSYLFSGHLTCLQFSLPPPVQWLCKTISTYRQKETQTHLICLGRLHTKRSVSWAESRQRWYKVFNFLFYLIYTIQLLTWCGLHFQGLNNRRNFKEKPCDRKCCSIIGYVMNFNIKSLTIMQHCPPILFNVGADLDWIAQIHDFCFAICIDAKTFNRAQHSLTGVIFPQALRWSTTSPNLRTNAWCPCPFSALTAECQSMSPWTHKRSTLLSCLHTLWTGAMASTWLRGGCWGTTQVRN